MANLEYLWLKENPIQDASVLADLPNLRGVDINIPPIISIRRDDSSQELPSVGQTLKYRVQLRGAWNVTGLNLSYITPHKFTSVKSVAWFGGIEHNTRNNHKTGTLKASGLGTGNSIRSIAIFTLNATAAGTGELRVEGKVTTTYGNVNVNTKYPLTIFPADDSQPPEEATQVVPISDTDDACDQKLTDPSVDACGTWVNLEPSNLKQLPTLKSTGGDSETTIIFVNLTGVKLNYYWVNYEGNEQLFGEVAANDLDKQSTYAGHVWLVKDGNGKNLAVFRAVEKTGRALVVPGNPGVIPDPILAVVVRDTLGLAPGKPITKQRLKDLTDS